MSPLCQVNAAVLRVLSAAQQKSPTPTEDPNLSRSLEEVEVSLLFLLSFLELVPLARARMDKQAFALTLPLRIAPSKL